MDGEQQRELTFSAPPSRKLGEMAGRNNALIPHEYVLEMEVMEKKHTET
jgi:hypothetical protein